MANKTVSKISRMIGMDSAARRRKTAATDVATQAGTKIPRAIFNMFGGNDIPVLESAFGRWESKRNKYAEIRSRKHDTDKKYHDKDPIADELKKTRHDADRKAQSLSAQERLSSAHAAAMAEQGSSQLKLLTGIKKELVAIRGALHIGNKKIGDSESNSSNSDQHGGAIRNWLERKLKNKFGRGLERKAIKLGGKRAGRLVRNLLGNGIRGAGAAEGTAAELAGSGITTAAAGTGAEVAGAGAAAAETGGGIAAGGSTLAAAALPAAAVAAAGAVGYGIGTLISKKLVQGTKAGDAIGSGIAHVLSFFGDKTAENAIKQNDAAGSGQVTPAQKAAWEKKHPKLLAEWAAARAKKGLPPVAPTVATTPEKAAEVKKSSSTISKIASHFDPMAAAAAAETPPASATQSAAKKIATPATMMTYLAGLYELASDKTKGLYVTAAQTPFSTPAPASAPAPVVPAQTPAPAAPAPSAPTQPATAHASTVTAGTMSASLSTVTPNDQTDYAPQQGAATNGGFAGPHRETGKLHFNVAGSSETGQDATAASGSIGVAPKNYGKVDGFDIDTMWDSMKGIIASGESGKAGYNAHHGGTIKGLTNMTLGQLKHMKGAMGKYQILPQTTLVEAMKGVGLTDKDKFSPANQEAMGKWLFARRVKHGAKNGVAGIQHQLADEWASLPMDATGRGAYDGDAAGNEASGGVSKASSMIADIKSSTSQAGSVTGMNAGNANEIDSATNDVVKADTSSAPVVIAAGGGQGGGQRQATAGTGSGLSGPMTTRDSSSTVQNLTQNFIAGSSANRA